MVKISLIAVVLYFLSPIAIAKIQNKVIYGDDNRVEFFQVQRADVREVADSTVAMIRDSNLQPQADGTTKINAMTFRQLFNVCSNEPYAAEPSGAMCSGFLVGSDLIATAGHCVTADNCKDSSFVFTYRMQGPGLAPTSVSSSEVYHCKEVLDRQQTLNQDYAVVRLDREVVGHRPLTLASAAPKVGDDVFVVGHPSGLPTKVADGANIREVREGYFNANLDTYGGNSGSAVFNAETLEVVGILVRGESDFLYDSQLQCSTSKRCKNEFCRGEDVTMISYVSQALQNHVR